MTNKMEINTKKKKNPIGFQLEPHPKSIHGDIPASSVRQSVCMVKTV